MSNALSEFAKSLVSSEADLNQVVYTDHGPVKPKQFTCPNCHSTHTRGPVSGTRMYECQCCYYVGRGFHIDRTIDAQMAAEHDEKQNENEDAP